MRTKVALARASTASPKATSDWTREDVAVYEDGPCRASICTGNQVCVKDTGACQDKISGCTPDCGTGEACVTISNKATCGTVIADTSTESYPNAFGDYIAIANGPKGLGVVFYDRIHGNLMSSANVGGGWQTAILDGETGSRGKDAKDTGDDGIGASLFIDDRGRWHVSYVDGLSETLKYLVAQDGANPAIEAVDDGDGLKQNGHAWTIKAVAQDGKFAGFFPHPIPGEPSFANWWRATDHNTKDITADVAFVSP
jgi:hypothetical protein